MANVFANCCQIYIKGYVTVRIDANPSQSFIMELRVPCCWIFLENCKNKKFEVFTAMLMKNYNFWGIMPCSSSKINWCFEGVCHLHLQGRRINHQPEAGAKCYIPGDRSFKTIKKFSLNMIVLRLTETALFRLWGSFLNMILMNQSNR
jgi:hypothetical protein